MPFDPNNHIVQLCIQGMAMEEKNDREAALKLFMQAWQEAKDDQERFLAAYFTARNQINATDRLMWTQTALNCALKINDDGVKAAFPGLYTKLAKCFEALDDHGNAKKHYELAMSSKTDITDEGPFYHGTKADLKVGDMLTAGGESNYQAGLTMNHIYFTALANGAGLAAALAKGDGQERVYIVEPTGDFENDPNVTDKKFPGNPTRSYRTSFPLKIVGELADWVRQTPEQIKQWQDRLANNKGEIIN